MRPWSPETACCPDDYGGSHYHCAYCGCVSSMQGHDGKDGPTTYCPPPEKRPSHAARFVWHKEK